MSIAVWAVGVVLILAIASAVERRRMRNPKWIERIELRREIRERAARRRGPYRSDS